MSGAGLIGANSIQRECDAIRDSRIGGIKAFADAASKKESAIYFA